MKFPLVGSLRPELHPRQARWRSGVAAAMVAVVFLSGSAVRGSDHSDAPAVDQTIRQNANLTDLYAFRVANTLVLALCVDPSVPPSVSEYVWPDDVTYEVNIDVDSAVDPSDPHRLGGTVLEPGKIKEEVRLRIRFEWDGTPDVHLHASKGLKKHLKLVDFFAGLRDDPFIRGPRQGRNVAAIVAALSIDPLLHHSDPLLIWATTSVKGFRGHDLAGRALRSMFPENSAMNAMEPRHMERRMGLPPDVLIYNLRRPAAFPNGRALEDDVVDLVGDGRLLANDSPFPSANDKPFLTEFPYLAPPHPVR